MAYPGFDIKTATIRFEPSGREVSVVHDSVLMDAVLQAGLPLGQSCNAVALCGFCRVQILNGLENLTASYSEEKRVLASLHAGENERLACCARINGPVTVTTEYW